MEISTSNQAKRVLAPVAVFVYNRLDNTRQVIDALLKNYLAPETDVIVYSDGPKDESAKKSVDAIRQYLRTINGFKSIKIVERESNYYIERNIIEGVTETIGKFGKIIVMEDDGVVARNFLNYINDALDYYQNIKNIMHIGSFTFIEMPPEFERAIIWQYTENTGGGWATWSDRWDKFKYFNSEAEITPPLSEEEKGKIEMNGAFKCLGILKLKPIPWDIFWYIALIRNNGFAINPPKSLMKNIGLYSGTHFSWLNRLTGRHPFEVEIIEDQKIFFEKDIKENQLAKEKLRTFYKKLGNRKRDKFFGAIIGFFVKIGVTKFIKRIIKEVNGLFNQES